jgi:hypothetical protein
MTRQSRALSGIKAVQTLLMRNFRELFIDPAEQARRLENYRGKDARLWIKDTEEIL